MLKNIFHSQTKSVAGAALILSASAVISRLFGVINDWLLAKTFGASPELDAYLAAFRIPDLVYNVLIAGGIVVVFLPLLSKVFTESEKDAWDFASNTLNIFISLVIFISLILFIFTPQLGRLVAPGFVSNPEQMRLFVFLTRLMFLSPVFFGLSSIFSSILQYFNRFFIYGLCPIFYNLGIIFGILFLSPRFGVMGVAMGVILGAFLHMSIQIPSVLNCGFKYKPVFNFKDSEIKKIFFLMGPRVIAIASQQINLIVITAIASTLASGSLVIFNFANDLQYFPISMFGISFATAVFPALSKSWAETKKDEYIGHFSSSMRQIIYLTIPVSFLMFILRNQIVNIVYLHGRFSPDSARLTGACLGLFCINMVFSSLIPLILRGFFSSQDTKTPTLISIFSMFVNVSLAFWFSGLLISQNALHLFLKKSFSLWSINDVSVLGLPLAYSFSAVIQFSLLMFFICRNIGGIKTAPIFNFFTKVLLSSIIMALIVYALLGLSVFENTNKFLLLAATAIAALLGIFVYFIFTVFFFKLPEAENILKNFFRKQ